MPSFRNTLSVPFSWADPPMKMGQSVPKCRHIKFRRRGITQKKAYMFRIFVYQSRMFIIIAITTVFEHYYKSNNNMTDLLLYNNFNKYFILLSGLCPLNYLFPSCISIPTNIFYALIFSHLLYDQPKSILVPANSKHCVNSPNYQASYTVFSITLLYEVLILGGVLNISKSNTSLRHV
jgi:hypothetical protein